jgi:SAM-dependent methyltransferase
MSASYELADCPVCPAASGETLADGDSIRSELEQLWAFHLPRLRTGVPVRNLFDQIVFSQDPPLRLERCRECGTVYRNPRERPESLVELYAEEEPGEQALAALFESQRASYQAQARRLTRVAGRIGRGLEVGSYVGAFLSAARERGWTFEGVDVNPSTNSFARGRGFEVRSGTLDELDGAATYDAIAIWNCFDQLPDPRAALRRAASLLNTGGILALRVPNGEFYTRWRHRLDGPAAPFARLMLAHNNLLGFPYRHGFTLRSVTSLLHDEGFAVVESVGDTLVPMADQWTRGWAAAEERGVKLLLRMTARAPRRLPWIEVYARTRSE